MIDVSHPHRYRRTGPEPVDEAAPFPRSSNAMHSSPMAFAIPRRIRLPHGIREPDIPLPMRGWRRPGRSEAHRWSGRWRRSQQRERSWGLVTRHPGWLCVVDRVADVPDTGDGRQDVAVVERAAVGRSPPRRALRSTTRRRLPVPTRHRATTAFLGAAVLRVPAWAECAWLRSAPSTPRRDRGGAGRVCRGRRRRQRDGTCGIRWSFRLPGGVRGQVCSGWAGRRTSRWTSVPG